MKMKRKKKMNTYLKYTLILLASLLVGALAGFLIAAMNLQELGNGAEGLLELLRGAMLPILILLTLLNVIFGEIILKKNASIGKLLGDAEDEEGDALEYELEQVGAIGLVGNNILTVLSLIILSTGYSLEYMESLSAVGNKWLLASFVVFILGSSYAGIWQVRLIKETQKIYPERAADPTSGKFQEQWLKSCDEAEREIIYQSSYKAYLAMMKVIPILTFAALLTHLLWNTGVLAVVFLGIAWIFTTLTYSRNCVVLKGKKLNT